MDGTRDPLQQMGWQYDAEHLAKLWDSDAGEWAPLLWLASVQRENGAAIP